jgi:hypothetical protein
MSQDEFPMPCPHCGCSNIAWGRTAYRVKCLNCGSSSPRTSTAQGALTVWNSRAVPESSPRYVLPGQWIPVSERLPKPYDTVAIIADDPGRRSAGWLNADGTWMSHDHGSDAEVTHWMPLPDVPKSISLGEDSKR